MEGGHSVVTVSLVHAKTNDYNTVNNTVELNSKTKHFVFRKKFLIYFSHITLLEICVIPLHSHVINYFYILFSFWEKILRSAKGRQKKNIYK